MKIVTTRNLNFHTKHKGIKTGLVHVMARRATIVPDDVAEMALFNTLVKAGVVTVLTKSTSFTPPPEPAPEKREVEVEPEEEEEEVEEVEDETGVKDDEEEE
jgi:hypothetical protein